MPVGENTFDGLRKYILRWPPESAERAAWAQVFCSLLTQASSLAAFPSYNVVLGFWGLYSVFTKSLQAMQVYLGLVCFSIFLDIIYCIIWGSNNMDVFGKPAEKFCLIMLILNMIVKAVAFYIFWIFYKEVDAGAIRPLERLAGAKKRLDAVGSGGAYDLTLLSTREEQSSIRSPDPSVFSAGSAASFALASKGQSE